MARRFVSAPLQPASPGFDAGAMARGEPGLPLSFLWEERTLTIAEVLERGRAYGDCTHGSGERYLRRHSWRVRTTDGALAEIYFQRSFGRSRFQGKARWWLRWIEEKEKASPPEPKGLY
ncbi:MAG: DUF6504 family protein [Verrucomicrobium sp.]|nr:DUF6504 family protein [Verrucomicrobium sp.]